MPSRNAEWAFLASTLRNPPINQNSYSHIRRFRLLWLLP